MYIHFFYLCNTIQDVLFLIIKQVTSILFILAYIHTRVEYGIRFIAQDTIYSLRWSLYAIIQCLAQLCYNFAWILMAQFTWHFHDARIHNSLRMHQEPYNVHVVACRHIKLAPIVLISHQDASHYVGAKKSVFSCLEGMWPTCV